MFFEILELQIYEIPDFKNFRIFLLQMIFLYTLNGKLNYYACNEN